MKTYKKTSVLTDFVDEIFKVNSEGPKAIVLKEHMDATYTKIKLFIIIQTVALLLFLCYPIYGYVARAELIQIMPMEFPFVDQATVSGFIVANLIMMKMGVWAYVGSVGFDVFLARTIYNYCALLKLLQQDILDFIEMSKVDKDDDESKQYREAFFRNFLIKCQDKDK